VINQSSGSPINICLVIYLVACGHRKPLIYKLIFKNLTCAIQQTCSNVHTTDTYYSVYIFDIMCSMHFILVILRCIGLYTITGLDWWTGLDRWTGLLDSGFFSFKAHTIGLFQLVVTTIHTAGLVHSAYSLNTIIVSIANQMSNLAW